MTYTYTITTAQMILFIGLALWELVWKALALWKAARSRQPYWFAAFLIINSAGILPILYLLLTREHASTGSNIFARQSHGQSRLPQKVS